MNNIDTLKNLERYVATADSGKKPITIIVEKQGQEEKMIGHIIRMTNDGFLFYPTKETASETVLKPPLLHTKNFHMDKPTADGYTFKSVENA